MSRANAIPKTVVAAAAALLLLARGTAPAAAESLLDPPDSAGQPGTFGPTAVRTPARATPVSTPTTFGPAAKRSWVGVVTAYCSAGRMADGTWTHPGAAAAEYDVPMHSRLRVAGVGDLVVEDRGQPGLFAVDVFIPSCRAAIIFGRGMRLIQILGS